MRHGIRCAGLVLGCLMFGACDDGGALVDGGAADASTDASADGATGPTCDDTQPPLIMAHGLLASGDTWAPHHRRFVANGYCPDRYLAFDWNTLNMGGAHAVALDAFIDAQRERLGVEQVDLMGHSAGGGLGYTYLSDPARAAKVRKYVHVGSGANDAPAGPDGAPVDMLNLWSADDLVVAGDDIPGAENVRLGGPDHYAVATNEAGFVAIHTFLYGAAPAVTTAPGAAPIILSGKGVVLGENTPEGGGQVEVWPVEPATGMRRGDAPAATFEVAADGAFGPFRAEPGQPYEFFLQPARESPPVRYYREAFTRSDPLVYLRTLPEPPGLAGVLLSAIPFDDAHTVLVVFSASRAVLAGADSLTVDGTEVATEALAAADDTTIAFFLYDVGTDEMSSEDGAAVGTFGGFPFLSGLDLFVAADASATTQIRFNDRALNVPRWPSASEGAVIAVFD